MREVAQPPVLAIGRLCQEMAILFDQLEGHWLYPEIEEIDEGIPEPSELSIATAQVIDAGVPVSLLKRLDNMRALLAQISPEPQSQGNVQGGRSGSQDLRQRLSDRLTEVKQDLKEKWLNDEHQRWALEIDRLSETPETLDDLVNAALRESPMAKAPWTTLIKDFDEFRWALSEPMTAFAQHVLSVSMLVYRSRSFQPKLYSEEIQLTGLETVPDLQLPAVSLSWGDQESLHSALESLLGGSVAEADLPSYLGIRFNSNSGLVTRTGRSRSAELTSGVQCFLFGKLLRNEGALLSSETIRNQWPGSNWSENAVQSAMSDLRNSISGLNLQIKNQRRVGYRLIDGG